MSALAAFALGLANTVAAFADTPNLSINTGSGWTQTSATPLFNDSQIVPGWTGSQSFLVRNDSSTSGPLYINAEHIVEDENGCTPPEALVDNTCGPNDGELGHALQFSFYVDPENDGSFEATPRWTGTVYDILSPTLLASTMPASSTWGVRVDGTLPLSTGNQTQSDQMGFDFALTLTGIRAPSTPGASTGPRVSTGPGTPATPQGPGSVEVRGIKVTRHVQTGVLHDITSQLPFTGTPAERLVEAALWLLIAGAAFTLLARARPRRTAVED